MGHVNPFALFNFFFFLSSNNSLIQEGSKWLFSSYYNNKNKNLKLCKNRKIWQISLYLSVTKYLKEKKI